MSELKPCPFCGNNAKPRRFHSGIFVRKTVHYVECVVCRVRTPVELEIERATETWNRRYTPIEEPEFDYEAED